VGLTFRQRDDGTSGLGSQLKKLLRQLLQFEKELRRTAGIQTCVLSRTGANEALTVRVGVADVGVADVGSPTILRRELRRLGLGCFRQLFTASLLHGEDEVRLLHATAGEEDDGEDDGEEEARCLCSVTPHPSPRLHPQLTPCDVSIIIFKSPENIVEADDGLRLRSPAAVEDGRLSLRPHKATAVRQETVVSGAHLTFGQHYNQEIRGR